MRKTQWVSEDKIARYLCLHVVTVHSWAAVKRKVVSICLSYRIVSDGLQRRSASPLDDLYTDLLVHVLALGYDTGELSRCPQQRNTASGLSTVWEEAVQIMFTSTCSKGVVQMELGWRTVLPCKVQIKAIYLRMVLSCTYHNS